jgi:sRNA-binding regulator protein Hfq
MQDGGEQTEARQVAQGRALAHFRLTDQTTPHGLYPAEERLLASAREGELCEIDGTRPEAASPENKVRAQFVRFLALGGDGGAPVHERGVWLRGAYIEGALDLQGCEGVRPLFLWNCRIDGAIILRDAGTRTINLGGSHVRGIAGDGAKIGGSVFLRNGFTAQGEVRFNGAEIGGVLDCENGRFENAGEDELSCERVKISGSVFLSNGFTAQGAARFLGAEIGGQLSCQNGRFENVGEDALNCDRVRVSGSVFLSNGFTAQGEVNFPGAEIGGQFACNGGTFSNKRASSADEDAESDRRTICAIALNLSDAVIKGTLWLGPGAGQIKPAIIEGSLDLRDAYASVLVDHADHWPAGQVAGANGKTLNCHIFLDGFTYGSFTGQSSLTIEDRKAWLERQPTRHLCEEFKPQPFEQLVKVLRAMGHAKDAREIAIFKEEKQLRRPTRNFGKDRPWYANPWNWLRWLFVELALGHGYRPQRIVLTALAVWVASALFFYAAAERGVMAPSNPVVFLDPQLESCRANWTDCAHPKMQNEHTPFQPAIYALDVMLPIVALGQEAAWAPMVTRCQAGQTWICGWWAISVMWFEIAFGWVFGLLLVTVVAGVVRRD